MFLKKYINKLGFFSATENKDRHVSIPVISYITIVFELFVLISLLRVTYLAEGTFYGYRSIIIFFVLGSTTFFTCLYTAKQSYVISFNEGCLVYRSFFSRREIPVNIITSIEKTIIYHFQVDIIYMIEFFIYNQKSVSITLRENKRLEKIIERNTAYNIQLNDC